MPPGSLHGPLIIAVDGRSGAGKTTLSLELASGLRTHHSVSLFHLEDIYPGWDGLQAGVGAYRDWVLTPVYHGTDARWKPWNWEAGRHGATRLLHASEIVIVEGVGAAHRAARSMVDVVIWCSATDDERKERALRRDGDLFAPFWDRWAEQEAELLAGDDVPAASDLLVEALEDADVPVHTMNALAGLPQAEHLLIPERTRRDDMRVSARRHPGLVDAATCFGTVYGASERAVWLDSSNAPAGMDPPSGDGEAAQRCRFSIMADDGGPLGRSATHAGGRTTIRSTAVTARIDGPFFRWLDTVWGHQQVDSPTPAPFALGWLGFLGYELKRETGGSDTTSHTTSDTPDAALIFATRALVFDHAEQCIYLLALDDGGSAEAWLDEAATRLGHLAEDPAPGTGEPPRHGERPPAPGEPAVPDHAASAHVPAGPTFSSRDSRREYLDRINAAQQQIRDGNSYEICLTTALRARPLEPVDPWQTYLRLRLRNRAPFASYLRFGDLHIASTSPERFLRLDTEGALRAEPIKGTRRRDPDATRDAAIRAGLHNSDKDRAENIMIVDLLRNDLSHFAVPGSVTVSRLCSVESYATVHQMVSTIDARLRPGADRASAVAAAFPAGSMTGAPKISTMDILDGLEQQPRGVYSGVLGYFSLNGAADLSVVIRTLVISADDGGQQLTLGVGGAITADSDPEAEWEEVRTKAYGVLSALGARFPD
ncbi:aminodeoxychorismate synthase component I [Arthrobacter castelli]|uniref:aminodeoxychorismate synthase component I n=1 Tax=Arthrobacter castelli TaxID=271431 RepID=UPI000412CB09|nr:aminodeoxychorismate synthase component I [Arthrobacter castelli]